MKQKNISSSLSKNNMSPPYNTRERLQFFTRQQQISVCSRKPATTPIQGKDGAYEANSAFATSFSQRPGETGGSHMNDSTRSFMENRFGYDFSNVKIHTDAVSAKSAQSVNALAYTVGNNIVFNDGQYSPDTGNGKRLLAHELTHVIQQNSNPAMRSIQRKTIYEEIPHHEGTKDGVYSGSVDRYQYKNRKDYNEREAKKRENASHHASVNVRFDSNRCVLEVPVSVKFLNNDTGLHTHCSSVIEPFRPLSQSEFDSAIPRIMALIPENLENWFNVHLDKPGVAGCRGSEIPIRIVLTENKSDPDFEIILTENQGSSYVGRDSSTGKGGIMVLCDSASESGTIIHEAGHMVLGAGDEYRKPEKAGSSGSSERLGEYSWMAKDAPERLMRFYERHFQFAPVFMNHVFPGCKASLVSGSKKMEHEIAPEISAGMLETDDGRLAVFLKLGLDMGIPLTKMRQLTLHFGPQIGLLRSFDNKETNEYNMFSLLMGVKAGLKYRTHLGHLERDLRVGLSADISGEAGGLLNFAGDPGGLPSKSLIPYVEANAFLGVEFESHATIGVEAGRGLIMPGGSERDIEYYKYGIKFSMSY